MSRQIPEAEEHEKLVANRFGVATQDIPVATRTRLLHQISIATLSKSIATESKKELRKGRDKKQQATTEANYKNLKLCRDINFYVTIERQIWARILGIHNTIIECGPTLESL